MTVVNEKSSVGRWLMRLGGKEVNDCCLGGRRRVNLMMAGRRLTMAFEADGVKGAYARPEKLTFHEAEIKNHECRGCFASPLPKNEGNDELARKKKKRH